MATYYVAEGGTATDQAKENATSGTYPGGCLSPAGHNAETFSAGDSVLFSDEGGVIRATITPPSSGSSGSPITYGVKSGDSPEISGADVLGDVWTENAGDNYLSLPGEAGDYASSPDSAALDIVGDVDVRADIAPDDWTPTSEFVILEKGWRFCYYLVVRPDGKLRFYWTEDDNTQIQKESSAATGFTDGTRHWVRATLDVDTGAGDADVKFWTSDDGSSWDQLGTTQSLGATTEIQSNSSDLYIGIREDGSNSPFSGKIYRVQVRDGIDGTIAFDADFSGESAGTTSFSESSTNSATVTINQSGDPQAEIVAGPGTNIWTATVTTEPEQLWFDTSFGDRKADADSCVGALDWFWGSNTLTVYSTSDPNTNYTSPGVEAGQRDICINLDGLDYITVDGLTITAGNLCGVGITYPPGSAASNITIQNCTVQWTWLYGIHSDCASTGDHCTNWLVQDNVCRYNGLGMMFHRNFSSSLIRRNESFENGKYQNDGETGSEYSLGYTVGIKVLGNVDAGYSSGDVVVEYNYSHDNGPTTADNSGNGVGIWFDEAHGSSGHENICRFNWIQDNKAEGVELEKSSYTIVQGNVIVGNGEAEDAFAIRLVRENGYGYDVSYNQIINNTVYGNHYGAFELGNGGGTDDCDYNIIKNNIFDGIPDGTGHYTMFAVPVGAGAYSGNNEYENNCLGAERGSNYIYWAGTHYYTISSWETAAGGVAANNNGEDPSFTNAGADDYTLASDSPCIGAGVNLGADYDDALMPSSTWPDGVVTGDQDDY